MQDTATHPLTIWKVGCPHYGGIPSEDLPDDLRLRAEAAHLACEVRSFPADDFHLVFGQALREGRTPDLLVIGNYGILGGITTDRGTFIGVHTLVDADDLIYVSSIFNSLLDSQGGWVHLVKNSPNHHHAVALASVRPNVPVSWPASFFSADPEAVRSVARAAAHTYLNGQADLLWPLLDHDHLMVRTEDAQPGDESIDLEVARIWGNHRLAFCGLVTRWPARKQILGGSCVVVALRRDDADWKVLFVSIDPITIEQLNQAIPNLARDLVDEAAAVLPVRIIAPENGDYPEKLPDDLYGPDDDPRFGLFKWLREPEQIPLAEIVEFASCDSEISDSRIFVLRSNMDAACGQFSSGGLWSTGQRWQWRVWSVGADGRLAFSHWREFYH